jgi:hypothetical protein
MSLVKLQGYMTLDELVQQSYEIAKSKGWWDKPRSFAALTLLMESEISEALEDYRAGRGLSEVWYEHKLENAAGSVGPGTLMDASPIGPSGGLGKPCGISSELADVVIRCCDFAGHYGLTLKPVTLLAPTEDFEVSLARCSMQISRAFDVLDTEGLDRPGNLDIVAICLSLAVQHLFHMCEAQDIPIWKMIEEKATYNRTRQMRHGGKAI